jgi:hypothetical protein
LLIPDNQVIRCYVVLQTFVTLAKARLI